MEEADYERDTSLEKKRKEIKRGSLTLFSGRWCRAEGGGLDHDACYAEPMQRHSRLVFSIRKGSHRVCGATTAAFSHRRAVAASCFLGPGRHFFAFPSASFARFAECLPPPQAGASPRFGARNGNVETGLLQQSTH
jgi:hypothetical protein